MSKFKRMVEHINKQVDQNLIRARYIISDGPEIVILEDFESNYYETVVIFEDKAHFFGENYPEVITEEEYYNNLVENWGETNEQI